jgi:hypothetical protein
VVPLFLWGAAAGNVYHMIQFGNFEPGNAGVIFYTDILVPLAGFALLWMQHRHESTARAGTSATRPH